MTFNIKVCICVFWPLETCWKCWTFAKFLIGLKKMEEDSSLQHIHELRSVSCVTSVLVSEESGSVLSLGSAPRSSEETDSDTRVEAVTILSSPLLWLSPVRPRVCVCVSEHASGSIPWFVSCLAGLSLSWRQCICARVFSMSCVWDSRVAHTHRQLWILPGDTFTKDSLKTVSSTSCSHYKSVGVQFSVEKCNNSEVFFEVCYSILILLVILFNTFNGWTFSVLKAIQQHTWTSLLPCDSLHRNKNRSSGSAHGLQLVHKSFSTDLCHC